MSRGLILKYDDGYEWIVVSEGLTERGLKSRLNFWLNRYPQNPKESPTVKVSQCMGIWAILLRKGSRFKTNEKVKE